MALALSLSFPLALTVSSASYSNRKLSTKLKELTEPQEAPTNKQ